MKRTKVFKKITSALIIVAIFGCMGKILYQNWQGVATYKWNFDYKFLLISFSFLFIYFLIIVFGWNLILKKLNILLSYKKTFKIYFISQVGKYIPGKFWVALGQLYLCSKNGLSKKLSFTSIVYEVILSVTSGILIFFFSLLFSGAYLKDFLLPLLLIVLLCLVFLYPPISVSLLNFALRKLGKEQVPIVLRYREILILLLLYCSFWIIGGIGLYFFVNSVDSLSIAKLPNLIGMYAICWTLGFLSFLTPAGLGVREGTFAFLLSYYFPLPTAILLSLLTRIWVTLGELVCIGISLKLH